MNTDRESEYRRDLAHVPGGNPMGGETFTIIEKRIHITPAGKRTGIVLNVRYNVPFGTMG